MITEILSIKFREITIKRCHLYISSLIIIYVTWVSATARKNTSCILKSFPRYRRRSNAKVSTGFVRVCRAGCHSRYTQYIDLNGWGEYYSEWCDLWTAYIIMFVYTYTICRTTKLYYINTDCHAVDTHIIQISHRVDAAARVKRAKAY